MVSTARETPTQDTHDFYIGRMVLGTQDIVQELQGTCTGSEIIEFEGLLVIPLMPRRILRNTPGSLGLLAETLVKLQDLKPAEEEIQVSGVEERYKSIGRIYSLRFPFLKLTPKSGLQEEASWIRFITDRPHRKGMPLIFRALESTQSPEVSTAATIVRPHLFDGNSGKILDLSVPRICATPKKGPKR